MLVLCIDRLGAAGYVYIDTDHFACPDDALALVQQQGRLHRNFQGYSTLADADLVACGVSVIGAVANTYSQNHKTLDAYYDCLDNNALQAAGGIRLNVDDLPRRFIIQMLMCNFELSLASIEQAYAITLTTYFASELAQLQTLEADGLLSIDAQWLNVLPRGCRRRRYACWPIRIADQRLLASQSHAGSAWRAACWYGRSVWSGWYVRLAACRRRATANGACRSTRWRSRCAARVARQWHRPSSISGLMTIIASARPYA